jgi:hypothetical protein
MTDPNDIDFPRIVTFQDSSAIDFVAWDPNTRVMRVSFKTTQSVWDYYGVWPSDFSAVVAAHSPGEVLNKRIRNNFDARRIHPEPHKEVLAKQVLF